MNYTNVVLVNNKTTDFDENHLKDDRDAESLSSITSLTMTVSSQISQRSEFKVGMENNTVKVDAKSKTETLNLSNMIQKKISFILQVLKQKHLSDTVDDLESVETLIDNLKKHYEENIRDVNNSADEVRLELANVLKELDEKEDMLAHITKGERTLKDANDTLNDYICQAEEYYSKELGTLKAKLSLTRIENEVSMEQEKKSLNKDISSPKQKSKKRSTLKFWKKELRKSSQPQESSEKIIIEEAVKRELQSKCIQIEELRGMGEDLERKISLLETTLQNRSTELNKKKTKIIELKKKVKNLRNITNKSSDLINEIQNVLVALVGEVSFLEGECKEHRETIKNHYQRFEKLESYVRSLNEENKNALSKISKKNYQLSLEKLKTDVIVGDVKIFLDEFFKKNNIVNVNVENDGLDKLLEIAYNLLEPIKTKKNVLEDKASQTDSIALEFSTVENTCQNLLIRNDLSVNNKNLQSSTKEICNKKGQGDSGFVLNDQKGSIASQILANQNKEDSKEFFEELIAYVEHVKNGEIVTYKQNLSTVMKDNISLRQALSQSYMLMDALNKSNDHTTPLKDVDNKLEVLTHDIRLTPNSFASKSPPVNIDEEVKVPDVLKRNKLFDEFRKMKASRRQLDYSTRSLHPANSSTSTPKNSYKQYSSLNDDYNQSENHSKLKLHDLHVEKSTTNQKDFLQSYEAGSTLIKDIFNNKNALEHKILKSREHRGRTKEFVT